VHSVNGVVPTTLAEFLVGESIVIVASFRGQPAAISATSSLADEVVVVHEKDERAGGRDVRTWHVRMSESTFTATARSLF